MSFAEYQEKYENKISRYNFEKFVETCWGEMLESYRDKLEKDIKGFFYDSSKLGQATMRLTVNKLYILNRMGELTEKYKISVYAKEIVEEAE